MADELAIWALDEEGKATELSRTNQTETEELLEEVLTNNPEMLEPSLTLVGRQLETAGGPLDLLGVDGEGRLVVFELKRGTLTRDAVTQVIDYSSSLEQMGDEDLAQHISARSGNLGTEQIDDFGEWYSSRFPESQESLKPVRMALVGLGVDTSARRMVDFLYQRGVDIALYTFYGYEHAGSTLLARQVEQAPPASEQGLGLTEAQKLQKVDRQAEESGIAEVWSKAKELLKTKGGWMVPISTGVTHYMPGRLSMPELIAAKTVHGSHSLRVEKDAKIRVTFFPAAVELCHDQFVGADEKIHFERQTSHNAPQTERIKEVWFCALDPNGWAQHRDMLKALVGAVNDAWLERLRTPT